MKVCLSFINYTERKTFEDIELEGSFKKALINSLGVKGIEVFTTVNKDEEIESSVSIERNAALSSNSKNTDLHLVIEYVNESISQEGIYADCSNYEALLYANSIMARLNEIIKVNGIKININRLVLDISNAPSIVLGIQESLDGISAIGIVNIADGIAEGIMACI